MFIIQKIVQNQLIEVLSNLMARIYYFSHFYKRRAHFYCPVDNQDFANES